MWSISDFVSDLLTAVGGQTVEDNGVLVGFFDERVVDLIGREDAFALGGFFFLTHAGPGIGINNMGVPDRLVGGITQEGQFAAIFLCDRFDGFDRFGGHVVIFRIGDGEVCAKFGGDLHQGNSDIVAITNVGNVDALDLAKFFVDGQHVSQSLAGGV